MLIFLKNLLNNLHKTTYREIKHLSLIISMNGSGNSTILGTIILRELLLNYYRFNITR